MRRRGSNIDAVASFFDGFSRAYDTVGRVTRDFEMRRAAEAEPELVESKIQPDAAPAVTMQQTAIQGREAKETGRIPTEKDSAATGLVEAPGVRLAAMEPVEAGSITVGPQLGKISMRHTLAGRDVNPGDKAGVERARELAMIDVVGKTDPMTANRMRRDVTSREREDKRFVREEARADRDDAKAKQEAADQAWLRDFGGVIARRDPQAIADFYNKQYGDGLTAQIVPGQNGSFGVVRVGKDGKPVDKTEFANVDQFISSAVPSLLATRDPLKSMALQRENEDRIERKARDADDKAHRERTTTSSEKFQAAQIANMEAQRKLQERGLSIQAEALRAKAKAGDEAVPGDGRINLGAIDKNLEDLAGGKDAEGNPIKTDPRLLMAVRALAARSVEAQGDDPRGAALAAWSVYQDALAKSGGNLDQAMQRVAIELDMRKTGTADATLKLGQGPMEKVGDPVAPPAARTEKAPPASMAMRELMAEEAKKREAKDAQKAEKKKAAEAEQAIANALTVEQIRAMTPAEAEKTRTLYGHLLPGAVLRILNEKALGAPLYRPTRPAAR